MFSENYRTRKISNHFCECLGLLAICFIRGVFRIQCLIYIYIYYYYYYYYLFIFFNFFFLSVTSEPDVGDIVVDPNSNIASFKIIVNIQIAYVF
jgi:hypothetical protein